MSVGLSDLPQTKLAYLGRCDRHRNVPRLNITQSMPLVLTCCANNYNATMAQGKELLL